MRPTFTKEESRMIHRKAVLTQLLDKAFKKADEPIYKLVSGKVSQYYVNLKPVIWNFFGFKAIGALLYDRIQDLSIKPVAVGGLEMGALPLANAVMANVNLLDDVVIHGFFVRKQPKDHGTGQLVEGCPLKAGDNVVVLEDVTTTGGSAMKAVKALRDMGVNVLSVITVVDRNEGGRELFAQEGVPFQSLFTLEELDAEYMKCKP